MESKRKMNALRLFSTNILRPVLEVLLFFYSKIIKLNKLRNIHITKNYI